MPSPFPGMDPYIEASGLWPDFHAALLGVFRSGLNRRLPRRYIAGIELHVWVHEPDAETGMQMQAPDLHIVDQTGPVTATAVAAAPATIVLSVLQTQGRRYLTIVDQQDKRVVTALEVLSPSNKASGPDRDAYLTKRHQYLSAGVNLLELDLLRGGARPPLGDPAPDIEDYYAMVCRSWEAPQAGFWTFGVRDSIPDLPIPLDRNLSEVLLPLRECLDRVYDEGRYGERLPYDRPTSPRLHEPDATWARELLAARLTPTPPTQGETP
jgi:Protein of unknown function (DUF4058)